MQNIKSSLSNASLLAGSISYAGGNAGKLSAVETASQTNVSVNADFVSAYASGVSTFSSFKSVVAKDAGSITGVAGAIKELDTSLKGSMERK